MKRIFECFLVFLLWLVFVLKLIILFLLFLPDNTEFLGKHARIMFQTKNESALRSWTSWTSGIKLLGLLILVILVVASGKLLVKDRRLKKHQWSESRLMAAGSSGTWNSKQTHE